MLAWLIVGPYDDSPFSSTAAAGRSTCPMQYCPLFPGCCKKADASEEPVSSRKFGQQPFFTAPDATREQIASDHKY